MLKKFSEKEDIEKIESEERFKMTNEELNQLSPEDKHLVIGIEDGWIDPTNEDLEKYYKLTGVDMHPIRTLITKIINRLRGI